MVLRPAQSLNAFGAVGAAAIDIFGNRGRANEAHRLDVGMIEQRVDGTLVAMDDIDHALGQPRLHQQLTNEGGGRGIAL